MEEKNPHGPKGLRGNSIAGESVIIFKDRATERVDIVTLFSETGLQLFTTSLYHLSWLATSTKVVLVIVSFTKFSQQKIKHSRYRDK